MTKKAKKRTGKSQSVKGATCEIPAEIESVSPEQSVVNADSDTVDTNPQDDQEIADSAVETEEEPEKADDPELQSNSEGNEAPSTPISTEKAPEDDHSTSPSDGKSPITTDNQDTSTVTPVINSIDNTISPANNQEENSSTPSPSPAAKPQGKKRLTLQERLALAAKGKASSKKKTTTPAPAQVTSVASTTTSTPLSLSPITSIDAEGPIDRSITPSNDISNVGKGFDDTIDSETETSKKDTTLVVENESEDDPAILKQKLEQAESRNQALSDQIRLLQSRPSSVALAEESNSISSKEKKELLAKLEEKDNTIEQLMREGEALSMKELKLNESIKKLKQLNSDLESSLHSYSDKNEETSLKLGELEDFLKTHKFKSVQQLIDSYTDLNHKYSQATLELEKELQQNWQGKYKEQQKLFEEELTARKQASKDLNDTKIQFEMLKRQNQLEVDSKESIINDLKRDITSLKHENQLEISRLENKIELLRLESESTPGTSNHTNGSKSLGSSSEIEGDDPNGSFISKQIDYEDYAKLSDNHHMLQQQFLSSQENWKVIESNLLSKVDNLTSSVDTLKKSNQKLSQELKKVNTTLLAKNEELSTLLDQNQSLVKENEEAKFALKVKESDYGELQEKLDKLKHVFNTDRANLDAKMKSLNETITKLHSIREEEIVDSLNSKDSGLNITLGSTREVPFRANSTNSITDTPIAYHSQSWQDIRLGESSATPISKDYSGIFFNNSNNSESAFTETAEESFDNVPEEYSLNNSRYPSIANTVSSGFGPGSITGNFPNTTTANSNIQLINKMSSNIRRLEIELNTLREENNQLSLEKESTEQELIESLKNSNELDDLKSQIEQLQANLEEKNAKEQTMLELIGEKSEQVEELRADVFDLKELCKLQVQQMIELQEAKQ
ncbi:TATA element modulatory factor 1 TATA binding-domain-containing protein [Scheffersomyces xylosifermentans]|uniref:TATA element modulatory factor 1 TATA binding-domain-containing protein n=1 Tax=Scheffersomyces xylosifermentans TaxID=1304137 RepID=UPI00315D31AE